MTEKSTLELIEKARAILKPRELFQGNSSGDVACALVSATGNLYLGVCIDISSGIGFCAEHSAIAAMITAGESAISKTSRSGERTQYCLPAAGAEISCIRSMKQTWSPRR